MDLSIIIVNYNTKKLVLECVDSIKKSKTNSSYEIIIVDNASSEKIGKSRDYILIENVENLGYAKANNMGIRRAKGDYILLLNSDTLVKKGSLDKILEFARSTKDAGVVGARLLNLDRSIQGSVSNFPTIFGAIREFWFGEKGRFGLFAPQSDSPRVVDSVVGAAFLITPQALKKVGLLNEKYFMYFEDLDYCRRVKKAGLKVYYFPDSEVVHYHGASGKKIVKPAFQWRRLIPSSKVYHGIVVHNIVNFILWSGQKFGRLIPIFFITLLTIPAFYKLVRPGYFPMQDDLQAFRVYEMDKCFTDLQVPCRWVPDAGYQYGYPQFNYYPPLPYYFGAVMHRVGIEYIDSVKILFIAGYILSAITMFILVDSITGVWPGVIAAILYTYIPYKATEVFVRGALSEFWAQIFFPLIFWAIYMLVKSGKLRYMVWMSVSIFLLATTHVLMTMIFAPVAILWAAIWLLQSKWRNLLKVAWGGILGFGLSAFFILPVISERQFIHSEGLLSGYFDYRQHFVSLYKLFLSREWGYGSSGFPNEKLNLSLGIVQWIVGLIAAPVVAFLIFRKNKRTSLIILTLVFLTFATIFMIHMKSSFIWVHLPFLWYMQFPWRFLAVSIFLLCLLSGFVIYFSGKFKYILGIVLLAFSFALTISFFVPKDWLYINDAGKFSGTSWEKQLTISIFDYLPRGATLPPWAKAPDLPEVLKGSIKFSDYKKGSNYQVGNVIVDKESTIRLPLFDFPGMVVRVDGRIVPHWNNDCSGERYCLGLITFDIPTGTHAIEAKLTNTPVRTAGNLISLATMVIVGYLVLKLIKNEKFSS